MKVMYFPNQPHCYAFGGFEVQMLSACDAARSQGSNIQLLDPWNRVADFDIVHLWGFEFTQYHNIVHSKNAKKKVIVTALLHDLSNWKAKARFLVSGLLDKQKLLKQLIPHIDRFVVVNDIEKDHVMKYYNFPADRIAVIPNIVSDIYFKQTETPVDLGVQDFVLCVGNICERKNQLRLVSACNALGYTVLLIGKAMEGEETYSAAVQEELSKNPQSKWIKGVRENSNVLMTAYKNCKIFALPSYRESQPISVLEAISAGCKVLLADKPYAYQTLFANVNKTYPGSVSDIKAGILATEKGPAARAEAIKICTSENVGRLYSDLYKQLI